MDKKMIFPRFLLLAPAIFSAPLARAQEGTPEMADLMRSSGKIWVVVAVLAVIFAGIFLYLIRLDRKLTRLEREAK